MHTITKRLPKLAGLAFAAVLAACSLDSGTSPVAARQDPALAVMAPDAPSVVKAQAVAAPEVERPTSLGHSSFLAVAGTTTSYAFTVNPTVSQSFTFGVHMVKFPAYTICNPSTSGYGAGTWLSSCTKLTSPISMVATTWTDAQGRARIDFNVDIRFYPNNSGQLPAIYLLDPSASLSDYSRIDYCATSTACVNEAATDATLQTQREPVTGYLFRLIRHFSGYNVWA
ncbi:MAG TPA: hypothetical protein VFV33_15885 [Gemmatimonadaceae bacterium]|nr:hypothetical protein [Gemmatimonadaceae bacterium]